VGLEGQPDRSPVLADRARSECARSMRAVGDRFRPTSLEALLVKLDRDLCPVNLERRSWTIGGIAIAAIVRFRELTLAIIES
jgi:hypothetical protein